MNKLSLFCVFSALVFLGCACGTFSRTNSSNEAFYKYADRTFPEYADFMNERYSIICEMPKGFIDQKSSLGWRIRENQYIGNMYSPILLSQDKECILMYPLIPMHMTEADHRWREAVEAANRFIKKDSTFRNKPVTNESIPRITVTSEIRAALDLSRDSVFDFSSYVTILAGKGARNMFNADSVFFYDIPMDRTYEEEYTYCTGLVISKKNRPTLSLKWFFTDKGKKNEKEYVGLIKKMILYNDVNYMK